VIDTASDYPGTILASALWNMQPTIDKVIEAVATDSFEPADYGQYSFMRYGGGSFVVDEDLADAEAVKAAREKEKEILDGLFRVNVNDAEPKSTM
jgi:basic membrane lipoprotein Med (substrate-binding protein (PBP1-ABC) superfamily)